MASELLKSVFKLDNLEKSWRVIQDNGRGSKSDSVKLEIEEFAEDAAHKLRSIQARLRAGSFKFGKAKGVPLDKLDAAGNPTGKFRPIVLASVEARIVQRAILNVLVDVPELRPFVKTPFSFGGLRKENARSLKRQLGKKSRQDNLSAVPAAIKAVLDEIGSGARFFASADIRSFFTRISKPKVTSIVADAVKSDDFVELFKSAIHVELENIVALREKANEFPIEEIGVAQGNSLSPLLGNIILADFDREMNGGDCRCIRYIDDFIILAPTRKAANARLRKAVALLQELGMDLSPEKSSKGAKEIAAGIEFLGISIAPGLIRPTAKAQQRFILSVERAFEDSRKAFVGLNNGQSLPRTKSLMATLRRVDGMVDGWGKHYWFCNDGQLLENLDQQVARAVRGFLGVYRDVRNETLPKFHNRLLGLSELTELPREPFKYPKEQPLQSQLNPAGTPRWRASR